MQLYYALKPITHGATTYHRGEPVDFSDLSERQRSLQVKFKKVRPATASDVDKWRTDGKMPVDPTHGVDTPVTDDALDLATASIVDRAASGQMTAQGKPTMEALRAELAVLGISDTVTAEQRDAAFARVTGAN